MLPLLRVPPLPSAFPVLSGDLDRLPEIPGGWTTQEVDLESRSLSLLRPAEPDLFLDDADVIAENERHDYMPYWAFLWPASIRMAQALTRAPWPAGSSVLEIGAGVGLVGLASLARGDAVTFSDYDRTALHLCRVNARRNALPDPATLQLDWRRPRKTQYPVIIGCEVTYDGEMHGVLLDLLERMLMPEGVCWLGDPGRYQSPFFLREAQQRGYDVRVFNERGGHLETPSSEGFQIFEMRRAVSPETGER